jgi:hypothetical protein
MPQTRHRPLSFFTNLFFYEGTVLASIWPEILLATLLAVGVHQLWLHGFYGGIGVQVGPRVTNGVAFRMTHTCPPTPTPRPTPSQAGAAIGPPRLLGLPARNLCSHPRVLQMCG